jgi:NAD(P)-dependent dehydrogenase (short-subunit alcohol dehydrogenase family)
VSSGRLRGLVALVNGAATGLGRATAVELAREGAHVVVSGIGTLDAGGERDLERAQKVVDQIVSEGGEAIPDGGDISDWAEAEAMVAKAIDRWGKLDIVVNAGGISRIGTPWDTTPEDFDDIVRVHLRGYFNVTHFAAKHWVERREYGRLINFVSGASLISQPTVLAYATAKTGLVGFTRSCANALVSYNVTANCIRPWASTPMMDANSPEARRILEETGRPMSELAIGTDLDPAHVTPLIVFLASPAGGHISGRLLEARGGKYVLWSEPHEERVLEANFLDDPEAVYAGLESTIGAGLSLRDLKMPMPPLETLGDWRTNYGTLVPVWDFATS